MQLLRHRAREKKRQRRGWRELEIGNCGLRLGVGLSSVSVSVSVEFEFLVWVWVWVCFKELPLHSSYSLLSAAEPAGLLGLLVISPVFAFESEGALSGENTNAHCRYRHSNSSVSCIVKGEGRGAFVFVFVFELHADNLKRKSTEDEDEKGNQTADSLADQAYGKLMNREI